VVTNCLGPNNCQKWLTEGIDCVIMSLTIEKELSMNETAIDQEFENLIDKFSDEIPLPKGNYPTSILANFRNREKDLRSSDDRKLYDIKKLWSRHKEIIRLEALGCYTHVEIAQLCGCTPQTVQLILNSTLGKEASTALCAVRDAEFEQQRDKIMEMTWKALDVYNEIIDNPNESNKLKKEVADNVLLELSGHKAATKIQTQSVSTVLSADELAEFKSRAFNAAKAAGKIIDVGEGK